MLTLEGTVLHVYETPKGVSKDGEEFGGKARVQLIGDVWLRNGQSKRDLIDLTVDDPEPFKAVEGRSVRVPVGVFARGSSAMFFHAKSAPEPLEIA